jgi:hypothetical protein
MSDQRRPSGPQFHADRPAEQEAVRTTIVGGRPPGSGQSVGPIPRGIEILIKKASVDPAFRELLLAERGEAAGTIGLVLEPAEAMMLAAAPAEQLQAVIARTNVPQEHRRAFLGQAAAAMLAAIGAIASSGCKPPAKTGGHNTERPDRPPTKGIQPDRPPRMKTGGALPDYAEPPPTRGIQPDRPEPKSDEKNQ